MFRIQYIFPIIYFLSFTPSLLARNLFRILFWVQKDESLFLWGLWSASIIIAIFIVFKAVQEREQIGQQLVTKNISYALAAVAFFWPFGLFLDVVNFIAYCC